MEVALVAPQAQPPPHPSGDQVHATNTHMAAERGLVDEKAGS